MNATNALETDEFGQLKMVTELAKKLSENLPKPVNENGGGELDPFNPARIKAQFDRLVESGEYRRVDTGDPGLDVIELVRNP